MVQNNFMKILEDILIQKYGEKIVNLGNNPLNYHSISDANGFAAYTGPCGDTMKIWIKITNNTIEKIGFLTDGCDCTRAVGSVLTKIVKGKKIQEASQITSYEIETELGGLPKDHKHCAVLAKDAFLKAIEKYNKKVSSKK